MRDLFTINALCFYGIAIAAMLLHAVKKWTAGELRGSVFDWYVTHPRASAGALLACLGGVAGGILSGQFTDPAVGVQVLAVAGIGYSADTLNSQGDIHAK